MHRRSFLKGISVAPLGIAAVVASESAAGGWVLSTKKGEPGYVAWCKLNGDGMTAHVYLNGVKQKDAEAVDQARGMVRRVVRTAAGNIAHDRDEILTEEVFGDVRVEIVSRGA